MTLTVNVGRDSARNDSAGYVKFSTKVPGQGGGDNLNNNVVLFYNANIVNWSQGIIDFGQNTNSDTQGGIDLDVGSPNSTITNYGTINRLSGQQDQTNKLLTIRPATVGTGANSVLNVNAGASINFLGKYDLQSGSVKKGKDSMIGGLVGDGGKMTFLDPGAPGFYNSYFLGDLVWNSGTIEFENSTPGAFTTADIIGGNLVLGSGASVLMNVDGTSGGGSDAFQVDGSASISSALLNITTENASPPSGQQYHIINPGLGFSGTGWGAPPANSGYPADYVFGDPGTLITL